MRSSVMEDRNFDLSIERIEEHKIVLRMWSKEKVILSIRDVKFYGIEKESEEDELLNFNVLLNNCYNRREFSLKRQISVYQSMNFIVKNGNTNKEYKVKVSIPEGNVDYEEINCW